MLTKVVVNSSSVACDRPNTFLRHLFVVPIILSHHPPHQAALGSNELPRDAVLGYVGVGFGG